MASKDIPQPPKNKARDPLTPAVGPAVLSAQQRWGAQVLPGKALGHAKTKNLAHDLAHEADEETKKGPASQQNPSSSEHLPLERAKRLELSTLSLGS